MTVAATKYFWTLIDIWLAIQCGLMWLLLQNLTVHSFLCNSSKAELLHDYYLAHCSAPLNIGQFIHHSRFLSSCNKARICNFSLFPNYFSQEQDSSSGPRNWIHFSSWLSD